MASGDSLVYFGAQDAILPVSGYATFAAAAYLGTPNGDLYLLYNASGDSATFRGVMPRNYSGITGVTINIHTIKTTTSTGLMQWACFFERDNDLNTVMGSDNFKTCNISAGYANLSTQGQLVTSTQTVANGTNMASVVAGDLFRLKISSASSDGVATLRGIFGIEIEET